MDGARVGPLRLDRYGGANVMARRSSKAKDWRVVLTGIETTIVVDRCPLSEVDARTREWIRSLAALLGPEDLPAEVVTLLDAADRLREESDAVVDQLGCLREAETQYDRAREKVRR